MTVRGPNRGGGIRRAATTALVAGVLSAGAVLFGGVVAPSGPASADAMASCTTTSGTIVAVDFSHWGGKVERGCAASPADGLDALHAAGFTTAGDGPDGDAFVCRIDDDPSPSDESCVNTPPVSAHWTYWHALAGQDTWAYSSSGVLAYAPPPGSVDAWTFGSTAPGGAGDRPTFPPSAVRATTVGSPGGGSPAPTTQPPAPATTVPTVAPTAPPPTAGGGSNQSSAARTGSRSGSPGTGSGGPAPTDVPRPSPATGPGGSGDGQGMAGKAAGGGSPASSGPAVSPPGSAPNRGAAGRTTPKIVDAAPVAAHRHSAGSPAPFVIGAVAVVALAGGAAVVARRRRRHQAD